MTSFISNTLKERDLSLQPLQIKSTISRKKNKSPLKVQATNVFGN